MCKKTTKKILLILLSTLSLSADTNMQQGVYDSAEEMMRFDEKMNRLISEHNQISSEDEHEMQKNKVEDFEETKRGYLLKQSIADSNNTKVKVTLKDGMLTVLSITRKQEVIQIGNERSYETTMSSSTSSLYLPQDANEDSMRQKYKNGVLEVEFFKK